MATNFEQLSENLFKTLQKQLDLLSERAPDLDVDFQDNNVLTITFEDDSQIVINKHQSNQEIWIAAKSGGYHFHWDEQKNDWLDNRSEINFVNLLIACIEQQSGMKNLKLDLKI